MLIGGGFRVAAPCPHQLDCPLAGGDWCHLPAHVERSALHRAVKGGELSYEDEKFSYVLATRLPVEPYAARVIRHPMIRKGLVGLPLCQADGTAAQRLVSKRQGAAYKEAKRDEEGWARVQQVGQIAGNRSSFDVRNYGFSSLSAMFRNMPNFKVERREGAELWVKRLR